MRLSLITLMRIPRLFLDRPLTSNKSIELSPTRAHYLSNVLRLKAESPLVVFNGHGGEFSATISTTTKKNTVIEIGSFLDNDNESPIFTELAIGVSKGDRMDWIVQKSTELGVNAIIPLLTERSEVKLSSERWEKKVAHWNEVIISACEQCGRNRLPAIQKPQTLNAYTPTCIHDLKLILQPALDNFDVKKSKQPKRVSILIGPEGGFSEDEVALAISSGFNPWNLGPRTLRTETAPTAALSILQSYFGDL